MKVFRLLSCDEELLMYVAQKLIQRNIGFVYVSAESSIECYSDEDLEFYADEYCCNCDSSSEYQVTSI